MSAEYISAALDLDVTGPDHTRRLALTLAQHLNAGDVLLLSGELGAGKTTFTRSLGEGLGVREGVISPTFVLSRVHPNLPDGPRPGGPDLVHVDAYRLSSAEELDDLDLEFSLPRSVTVIEWGRDKAEHLSDSRLELDFTRLTGADALRLLGRRRVQLGRRRRGRKRRGRGHPRTSPAAGARLRPPLGARF